MGKRAGIIYLSEIRRRHEAILAGNFPWTLPLFRDLKELEFKSQVTFLVGENGSGKSTLIEGLAVGVNAVAAGSNELDQDETLWAAHELAGAFRFVRRAHPRRTMFLRAEDVFGYTLRAARLYKEAKLAMGGGTRTVAEAGHETEQGDGPEGSAGAITARRLKRRLERQYPWDPAAQSHGETFLQLLSDRLRPDGLYFLDEPETPLSPTRVLALLALLTERAARNCQFVIATHSPILMALPNSEILLLEEGAVRPTPYQEVEHVRITKAFLTNPQNFLRHL